MGVAPLVVAAGGTLALANGSFALNATVRVRNGGAALLPHMDRACVRSPDAARYTVGLDMAGDGGAQDDYGIVSEEGQGAEFRELARDVRGIARSGMLCDEVFEIQDFSVATPWERLIGLIEEALRSWLSGEGASHEVRLEVDGAAERRDAPVEGRADGRRGEVIERLRQERQILGRHAAELGVAPVICLAQLAIDAGHTASLRRGERRVLDDSTY